MLQPDASLMLASNLTLSFLFSLHWLQLILKFLLQFPNLHKDHRIKKTPDYLSELLVKHIAARRFHSQTQNLLAVPHTRLKTGAFNLIRPSADTLFKKNFYSVCVDGSLLMYNV